MSYDNLIRSTSALVSYDNLIRKKWKPRPNRRECCNDPQNMTYALDLNNNKDKVALKCRKCGAVHYYALHETGDFVNRLHA